MLLTEYLVGRTTVGDTADVLCLIVDSVLPLECEVGRGEIVKKLTRQDLVLEFVSDQEPVEWLAFPDLPEDVVSLLGAGHSIPIVDTSDNSIVIASISNDGPSKQAAKG